MRAKTQSRRAMMYRGDEGRVAPKVDKTDIKEEGPGTVECAHCGARVRALVSGRPRAHSAGGFTTNTRVGRYKCPGSGNDGRYPAS